MVMRQGQSDDAFFEKVWYDPAPIPYLVPYIADAAGRLRFEGDTSMHTDEREARTIAILKRLSVAEGPRADALREKLRHLVIDTWPRLGGPFDLGWLTGLRATERLAVYSNTGIIHARALAALPALEHLTLYAFQKNSIRDLDGLSQSKSLRSLDLWWGTLGDLRSLAGPWPLRRLSVHENRPFSLKGIEALPLDELDLWLPHEPCDLSALASMRSLRAVSIRGPLTLSVAAALSKCTAPTLHISQALPTSAAAIARLPPSAELSLSLLSLDVDGWTGPLPMTSLEVHLLDAAGLRLLARSPRLRTLRVRYLDAVDLAPLADHPSLCELRFRAPGLRSLDRVPRARFLPDPADPGGPNRLVLKGAPLVSIREIGHLRGVEHLDLRECRELSSLAGVEGMHELQSIDLRECTALRDMSALESLPRLSAVLANHRGPFGPFPKAVEAKVVRAFLRGFVRRLHRGGS